MHKKNIRLWVIRAILLCFIATGLSACGGGGGGGGGAAQNLQGSDWDNSNWDEFSWQ